MRDRVLIMYVQEDENPFDSEVGTWHKDKWFPPGVTEFNFRTMDRWNDSPYDPPEVTHDFMKETVWLPFFAVARVHVRFFATL